MSKLFYTILLIVGCHVNLLAHEVRPALLKIVQTDLETYSVTWKVPTINEYAPKISIVFPAAFKTEVINQRQKPGAVVKLYSATFPSQLGGEKIAIENLSNTLIDVVVLIELLDGTVHNLIVQPDNPSVVIPKELSNFEVAKDYLILGIEHIWLGWDHLLFVLCLLLLISGFTKLIKTITAFTVAHSITLALSTLQVVSLPGPPVEAIIALSIVFLAREYYYTLQGEESLTARSPWVVAFAFGLLHGFGFAGALAEIGLPQRQLINSLLFFNLGIELGQIIFVCAIILVGLIIKRILTPSNILRISMTYSIGAIASYWLIERIINF